MVRLYEGFGFENDHAYVQVFDFEEYVEMCQDREEEVADPRGIWFSPFPNTEEDSFALGSVEVFSQSDIGKMLVSENGPVVVYTVASGPTI
jgi:hypothetical protein